MKTFLTAIFNIVRHIDPAVGSLMLITSTLGALFSWVNGLWGDLLARMGALAQANFAGSLNFDPVGLVDTFLPLHETLSLLSIYLTIIGTAAVIRIVKSFIPTIAT